MTDARTAPSPRHAAPSSEAVKRRLAAELALPSRLGHTLLLLVGLAGAAVAGSLLATEPALPPRTRIAFAALVAIGLAWAAFAGWVLARRRVLLAAHRVVAARMAIVFCAAFTLGALVLRSTDADGPWSAAALTGGGMLGVAVALLVRAHARRAALTRRLHDLERQLGGGAGSER